MDKSRDVKSFFMVSSIPVCDDLMGKMNENLIE